MTEQITQDSLSREAAGMSRKSLLRGGATALLGAVAVTGAAGRADAAPVPPDTRGQMVRHADPRVNRVIDVVAWGATGNGKTDDTAAIQSALDAATKGETVVFPEGRYKVTSTLTHSGSLGLAGMGPGLSIIDWSSGGDAIDLTFSTSAKDRLVLHGLTVNAATEAAGTAISAVWSSPARQGYPHAVIEDLEVTRGDGSGQRWQRGVYLDAAWVTSIRNYLFLSGANTGVGLELEGQSVDCNLFDVQAQSCEIGILLGASTEGTVIDNAVILDAVHGVTNKTRENGTKGPMVTVTNSHMNTRASGVTLTGTGDSWVINNLFYKFPPSTVDYTGVSFTGCGKCTARGNEIFNVSPANTTNIGVVVRDSSECVVDGNTTINLLTKGAGIEVSASPDIRVMGNHSRNVGTGIRIGPGSDRCMVAHNAFRITNAAALPNAVAVVDDGQDNLVESNTEFTTG